MLLSRTSLQLVKQAPCFWITASRYRPTTIRPKGFIGTWRGFQDQLRAIRWPESGQSVRQKKPSRVSGPCLLKIRRQQEAIEKPGRISADGDATRQDVTALVSVTSDSVYGPLMDQFTKWLTAAQSTGWRLLLSTTSQQTQTKARKFLSIFLHNFSANGFQSSQQLDSSAVQWWVSRPAIRRDDIWNPTVHGYVYTCWSFVPCSISMPNQLLASFNSLIPPSVRVLSADN